MVKWSSNVKDKKLEKRLKRLMRKLLRVAKGGHISMFVIEGHADTTVYGKEGMESIWTTN